MNKSTVSTILIGGVFATFGLVFLMTLVDLIDSNAVYTTLLPVVLMGGGISVLSAKSEQMNSRLGLALLVIGFIALLVRYNLVNGRIVNGVLGLVLLVCGVIMITMMTDRLSHDSKKKQSKE